MVTRATPLFLPSAKPKYPAGRFRRIAGEHTKAVTDPSRVRSEEIELKSGNRHDCGAPAQPSQSGRYPGPSSFTKPRSAETSATPRSVCQYRPQRPGAGSLSCHSGSEQHGVGNPVMPGLPDASAGGGSRSGAEEVCAGYPEQPENRRHRLCPRRPPDPAVRGAVVKTDAAVDC